ncbi:hypothetical protein ACLB2K_035142 [Fragaria x ananassa]
MICEPPATSEVTAEAEGRDFDGGGGAVGRAEEHSCKCIGDQQLVSLLNMKKSLVFNASSSSKLVSWNSSTDCCSWLGITCSDDGRVTGLDISSESISDGIDNSSSLFHLQHLQSLNLAGNLLGGDANLLVPTAIGQLKNLRLKLKSPNINMLVRNLTELTELHLSSVQISSQGSNWGQAISSLPNLRGLSDCSLQGIFPKEIFQVPSLRRINLLRNFEVGGSLPEFPENGYLRSLILAQSNFSGLLPNSIGNLAMLSTVDISSCNFTGPLPKSMANLTQLISIEMDRNNFEGSIPCFDRAKNLEKIDLSYNGLTGSISCTWGNLSNLNFLSLHHNMVDGNIPSSLFSHTSIIELVLSKNQFTGQPPKLSVNYSYSMESLVLNSNNLEGPIPMSIFNFRRLQILDLSSNNLSDSFPLDGFRHQRSLEKLDLSYNNIFLSYDNRNFSYSSFPQFRVLMLASGNLRTFPVFLKNQSQLFDLDLSNNQICGEVPNWIWKFKSLISLNLSCNSLDALEASSVSNLSFLGLLDIHSNNFQGQIPRISSPNLYYLDYSRNGFNSKIPTIVGNTLLETAFISLSSNNLHGAIPRSMCKSLRLEVLDLSNNSLSGMVPKCLTTMTTLAVLNLKRNNLTKVDLLSKNCSLETLDISENRIQGHFLESLVNCRKLKVLNLGSNQIAYQFPCFLKNISTLRVLNGGPRILDWGGLKFFFQVI